MRSSFSTLFANDGELRFAGHEHEVVAGSLRGKPAFDGVTRELTIPVRVELGAESIEATGATTIRQTDFGITPISVAGIVKVKNELALRWRLVGRAARR
jgi:polyisoprenoid-binding protein YceI